ncbi:MAG: MarR family transcriptional regulator [Actinobacteria bacterium]|nr:MarR family transcriptional regulator [Actinomycetota bacterium]
MSLDAEIGHNEVVKYPQSPNPGPNSAPTGAPARVARVLLESGPSTASELAATLGLTGTAIRRQLDSLVESGLAEASDTALYGPTKPRGRGRPAKLYTLTDTGRSAFDQGYDDLALAALRHLAQVGGEDAIVSFAEHRATEMEERYSDVVSSGTSVAERAELLAAALREEGFASTADTSSDLGVQLCQHNCPVAHVAQEFPQLCDAEAEAFGRLVGTHVTRLATLSHGDGICTTHIPLRSTSPTSPSSELGEQKGQGSRSDYRSERTPA